MPAAAPGEASYLDVRYASEKRPFTDYPAQLTSHLTERYLAERRGRALLDLGCGRGEFLHGFSTEGFEAVGIDRCLPSERRFPERVVVGDYEKAGLPFEDASFSVLFNKSVLEHVRDIGPLLAECARVLEPGGRMISMVPDWRAQWRHYFDDWTHVRPFTLTGLRECISCHGFSVRDARRFRQLPSVWRRPYLHAVATTAALLPEPFKRWKYVRFAKEWMLLVVADKPGPA